MARRLLTGLMVVIFTLANMLPVKAQEVLTGHLEFSKGTPKKGNSLNNTLRLYPKFKLDKLSLSSLTELNDYSESFGKTNLSYDIKRLGPLTIKPSGLVYSTSKKGGILVKNKLLAGTQVKFDKPWINSQLEYGTDFKETNRAWTYTEIKTWLGDLGIFSSSYFNKFKKTYMELGLTGKGVYGVKPYGRINLQKGFKPSYQIGLSINPFESYKK